MQLKLFDRNVIFEAELYANSPKKAFYYLSLVFENCSYIVEKKSGANGKILDQRKWIQRDRERAGIFFANKLLQKLSSNRKRQYFLKEI